ncbi:BLUF domain-containing protein [Methylogaea oryzae]|nr:BLUF domain-containing protein [Methylogaea oryzae]
MPLRLIAYISEYTGKPENIGADLADIRRVAKRFNRENGISGVLFFLNNRFMQVLEGEAGTLSALLRKIEADPRHTHLSYLLNAPITQRELADWNMDTFHLTQSEVFRPQTLQAVTRIYTANVEPDARSFLTLLEDMLNDPEVLRIVNH